MDFKDAKKAKCGIPQTRVAFVTSMSGSDLTMAEWFLLPQEAPPKLADKASTQTLQKIHQSLSEGGKNWNILSTHFENSSRFSPEISDDHGKWEKDEEGREVLVFHDNHPIFSKDENGRNEHYDSIVFPLAKWGAKMLRYPPFGNPNTIMIMIQNHDNN